MKTFTGLILAVVTQAFVFQTVLAQDKKTALVPLPSVDDFTKGQDGWGFGLGLGVEYESAYEGSDEFGFEAQPAGGVQWRRGNDVFYFAGEALGWRGLRADQWLFDAVVAFDEGRQEGDSDDGRLKGLGNAEEGTQIVLQTRYAFDADWRYWLDGRVVTGDTGSLALLGAGRRFGEQKNGTGSELSIGAVFHNSELANKDFGITSAQSVASGLNPIMLGGGFRSIGLNYTFRNYINDNWQIFGEVFYEQFGSDVADSLITRSNYEAEVGIGFIYVF
jgi:outer membrane protein